MRTPFDHWPAALTASSLAMACGLTKEETADPAAPRCTGAETGRYCVTPVADDGPGHRYERSPDGSPCRALTGVVRDFRRGDLAGGHPDFEAFWGSGEPGLLAAELGFGGKPVLSAAEPSTIHSSASFAQWYEDVEGVNAAFGLTLEFDSEAEALSFGSTEFFPVDDRGFGNEGFPRNYGFTTELHATFRYDGRPDAVFTFVGDDDLWVFINGRLAIDLGGVHPPLSASFVPAEHAEKFGLIEGNEYPIDLFHAERRASQSSFVVHTNLEFMRCGRLRPVDRPLGTEGAIDEGPSP